MMQALIKRVKQGRFVLVPISDQTRGHGTHSLPEIWGRPSWQQIPGRARNKKAGQDCSRPASQRRSVDS